MANYNNTNYNNSNKKAAMDDYITVNERLMKFYEKYPQGRVITELIKWEDGIILMKAMVYRNFEDDKPIAIGHSYEKEGSSYINNTSALENCETSAVGRAIALAGFAIKKSIASKEEVENAKRQQERIQQQEFIKQLESIKVSKEQVEKAYEIGEKNGRDKNTIIVFCTSNFKKHIEELNMLEYNKLLTVIKRQPNTFEVRK